MVVESAIGASADDQASLVRFLHYVNQWDLRGIIADDPAAVTRHLAAYQQVRAGLAAAEDGYPTAGELQARVVAGGADPGVRLIVDLLRAQPERPLWFLRWSPSTGPSSLRRALDRLAAEDSGERYRRLLGNLSIVGAGDDLGQHRQSLGLHIDTTGLQVAGAAALAAAPGFVLERDVRAGGNPLGALYPVWANERASFTFLHLLDNGLGQPHEPRWMSWGGRFVPDDSGLTSAWVAAPDAPTGMAISGAATVAGFATHIQNDFSNRLARGLGSGARSNRAPVTVMVTQPGSAGKSAACGPLWLDVTPGLTVTLDASGSGDPDGDLTEPRWSIDAGASSFQGLVELSDGSGSVINARIPEDFPERQSLHILLALTDDGQPALTSYCRIILTRPR